MLEDKTQELMVNVQAVLPLIVTNALSALGAIVILLIGLWLSGKADQLVVRVLSRTPHFDPTLKSFFGSLARYLIPDRHPARGAVAIRHPDDEPRRRHRGRQLGGRARLARHALQPGGRHHAADLPALQGRPQGAGRRQPRQGQGAVAVLDRAGDRRQGPDHRAEWRRLGPAVAQLQCLSGASPCRRGALPDREGTKLEPAIEKVRAIVEAHPHVLLDPAPRVLLDCSGPKTRSRSLSLSPPPRTRPQP